MTLFTGEISFIGEKHFQFPFILCIVMAASEILFSFWSNLSIAAFLVSTVDTYWYIELESNPLQKYFQLYKISSI